MGKKLLYNQIVDYLRDKIINNDYKEHEKLPTELELSNQFKVSRITSKRALEELKQEGLIYRVQGKGSFVAPYEHPKNENTNDGSNANGNDRRIIAIVMEVDSPQSSFMHAVRGASDYINEYGYYLSFHGVKNMKDEKEVLMKLYKQNISGIILFPISDRGNMEVINMLYLKGIPVVTGDKYFDNIPLSYVVSDNYGGGYKATQYLASLGHKKIGFVCDVKIENVTSLRNRYFGYCKALKDADLLNTDYIKTGFRKKYKHVFCEEIYKEIIETFIKQKVTAIFAANDIISTFIITAAMGMNVKIPEDISLMGFDNDERLLEHLPVRLTSVSQEFYNMGKIAAKHLINHIRNKNYDQQKIHLAVEIVERNSCKRIK